MEKIRTHIEELFKDAPDSKKTIELKEELISDLEEKYADLVNDGVKEREAFSKVISGIGDIEVLLKDLENNAGVDLVKQKKKTALVVSGSVGMYFLSLIVTIIADELNLPEVITGVGFLILAAIPTCILIYYFMSLPSESKDKIANNEITNNKEIRNSISGILWLLITIIYLVISFKFGIWYISWIIFIIGALIESIIDLFFKMKE